MPRSRLRAPEPRRPSCWTDRCAAASSSRSRPTRRRAVAARFGQHALQVRVDLLARVYRASPSSVAAITSPDGFQPSDAVEARCKPRTARNDAWSSTTQSATWTATSTSRPWNRRRPTANPAWPLSDWLRSSRAAKRAGRDADDDADAAPRRRSRTAARSRSAVRSSWAGSSVGSRHALATRVPAHAIAAPPAPPHTASRIDSVSSCRAMRVLPAPSAVRNTISRARSLPRASSRPGEVRASGQHQQRAEPEQAPRERPCRAAEHVAEQPGPRQPHGAARRCGDARCSAAPRPRECALRPAHEPCRAATAPPP